MKKQKGSILMLTLIFTALFAVTAVGIAGVINYQYQLAQKKVAWQNAQNFAEAGLDYYKWHLKHSPTDYYDGTGAPGTYTHSYTDPLSGAVGSFALNITPPSSCSNTITIKSTGWTNQYPQTKRKVQIKYGKQSLADYAFVSHVNTWFGDMEALHGPVHSNGGIRQDGTNDSSVTSYKATYTCQTVSGCSGNPTKPGVWGAGGNRSLWSYPASNFDFDAIAMNYDDLQAAAQISLPQRGPGYHLVFQADGTLDVYNIKKLKNPVEFYDTNGDRHNEAIDIDTEEPNNNYFHYPLAANCAIIFAEENIWVSGVVEGRVTVVAAKLSGGSNAYRTIYISGNLTYNQKDGSDVLGLIAQKDIIVPRIVPNDLEINAAMLAQNGAVYRPQLNSDYAPYHLRNSISVYGSIITKQTWTWNYVNGWGTVTSGFRTTNSIYDPHLTYSPPPAFPTIDEYSILQWEEVTEK
jgi:hypothetical protein